MYDSCTGLEPKLTHGTVGSHPVGIAAAQPSLWNKGAVTVALFWALGPGQLTVEPPPAWLAVALPVHTDAIVRTRGIQTIHCIKQEVHHMKRQSILIKKGKHAPPSHKAGKCQIRAEVRSKLDIMSVKRKETPRRTHFHPFCPYKDNEIREKDISGRIAKAIEAHNNE